MEPYEGTEPYIFMSYARKDWERVKPFLDALSNAGYRLWWDKGISAGADWLDTLLEKAENCAVFCPLFSEAFKDSYYCSEETKWAYRKEKTIVLLHLEKMTPDGLPRLYELLQSRQDLRLYEYADAAQFAERLGHEQTFAPCKDLQRNNLGAPWPLAPVIARNQGGKSNHLFFRKSQGARLEQNRADSVVFERGRRSHDCEKREYAVLAPLWFYPRLSR